HRAQKWTAWKIYRNPTSVRHFSTERSSPYVLDSALLKLAKLEDEDISTSVPMYRSELSKKNSGMTSIDDILSKVKDKPGVKSSLEWYLDETDFDFDKEEQRLKQIEADKRHRQERKTGKYV